MADVFISYHETSAGELAERIADALTSAGISTWCARRDLPLGGDFTEEIPNQIRACRLFLLILNENVYNSPFVKSEAGIAFKANIPIFPLETGPCPRKGWLELYLIHPQSVPFPAQPDEQRLQRLVNRVAKALNKEPPPVQPPKPQQLPVVQMKRGQCGDDVTYMLHNNGILTISGRGPMWSFTGSWGRIYNTPWWHERKMISSVGIQTGVTRIGKHAFENCTNLKSVKIPDSVTIIESDSFYGCVCLTSVSIPDGVSIEDNAFALTSLKSVSIPAKARVDKYAFPPWCIVTRRR